MKICLFYSLSYLVSTRYLGVDPLFPTAQQEVDDQLFSSEMRGTKETGTETEMGNFQPTELRINFDMMPQPEIYNFQMTKPEVDNTQQTFPEIEDTKETRQEVQRSTDLKRLPKFFEYQGDLNTKHPSTGNIWLQDFLCPVVESNIIL